MCSPGGRQSSSPGGRRSSPGGGVLATGAAAIGCRGDIRLRKILNYLKSRGWGEENYLGGPQNGDVMRRREDRLRADHLRSRDILHRRGDIVIRRRDIVVRSRDIVHAGRQRNSLHIWIC